MNIYPLTHIHQAYARAVALGASHEEAVAATIALSPGIAEEAVREVVGKEQAA